MSVQCQVLGKRSVGKKSLLELLAKQMDVEFTTQRGVGILCIFDITDLNSLEFVRSKYVHDASRAFNLLIGTKLDLEDRRQVQSEDAIRFAQKHAMSYHEVSCVTKQNMGYLIGILQSNLQSSSRLYSPTTGRPHHEPTITALKFKQPHHTVHRQNTNITHTESEEASRCSDQLFDTKQDSVDMCRSKSQSFQNNPMPQIILTKIKRNEERSQTVSSDVYKTIKTIKEESQIEEDYTGQQSIENESLKLERELSSPRSQLQLLKTNSKPISQREDPPKSESFNELMSNMKSLHREMIKYKQVQIDIINQCNAIAKQESQANKQYDSLILKQQLTNISVHSTKLEESKSQQCVPLVQQVPIQPLQSKVLITTDHKSAPITQSSPALQINKQPNIYDLKYIAQTPTPTQTPSIKQNNYYTAKSRIIQPSNQSTQRNTDDAIVIEFKKQVQQQFSTAGDQISSRSMNYRAITPTRQVVRHIDINKSPINEKLFRAQFQLVNGKIITILVHKKDSLTKLAYDASQKHKLDHKQYNRLLQSLQQKYHQFYSTKHS